MAAVCIVLILIGGAVAGYVVWRRRQQAGGKRPPKTVGPGLLTNASFQMHDTAQIVKAAGGTGGAAHGSTVYKSTGTATLTHIGPSHTHSPDLCHPTHAV